MSLDENLQTNTNTESGNETIIDGASVAAQRRNALICKVDEKKLDAYYCRNTSDIRWLTNFDGVFDSENAHLALICGNEVIIHTDSRYFEAMDCHSAKGTLKISNDKISHAEFAANKLADMVNANPYNRTIRIGVEPTIELHEYKDLVQKLNSKNINFEIEGTKSPMRQLRRIKDNSELLLIKKAQQITDMAFESLLKYITSEMTEKEVACELEYIMKKLGATSIAFSTIAASGTHASMPHAVPSDKKLKKGDFLVLDFGAKYLDYCSDMTRTIAIGEPSQEMIHVYNTVLDAQFQCKEMISSGVKNKKVHELADKVISDAGYSGRFTHSLGHGVGIDIHEEPNLSSLSTDTLVSRNVVTVEPGIYIPNKFGVRIEDFGVVKDKGFYTFTTSTHELQVID